MKYLEKIWDETFPTEWTLAVKIWSEHIESVIFEWCQHHNIVFIKEENLGYFLENTPGQNLWCTVSVRERLDPKFLSECQKKCVDQRSHLLIITSTEVVSNHYSNIKIFFYPELYGALCIDDVPIDYKDEKVFNCLMRRADMVRQNFLYLLHAQDLIDHGFVTYMCLNPEWNADHTHVEIFDSIHFKWFNTPDKVFHPAWKHLRDRVPLQNIKNDTPLSWHHWFSKYSLIMSTHNDSSAHWFNEKEAKALQSPSIFLSTLSPDTIKKLQQWGLSVDFNFALLMGSPWYTIQEKLIDIIRNDDLSISALQRQKTCKYNQLIFKQWKEKILSGYLVEKIVRDLSTKIKTIRL